MSWPDLALRRLGLALIALTAAAWVTGAPYLLVRLGLPLPVGLARFDGPHFYLGAVLAVVVAMKMGQLHLRRTLSRLTGVLLWQRWLSLGLVLIYGGVLVSGLLLLLPWPSPVARQLVNLHLMTALWAAVMSAAHAFRYLRNRFAAGMMDARLVAVVVLMLIPGMALLAAPRAAGPLTQSGAGASWQKVGPHSAFVYRLLRLPDGELLASGVGTELARHTWYSEALWTSADEGRTWSAVPGFTDSSIRTLAAGLGGTPVYLGTERGVWMATAGRGPYRQLSLQSSIVSLLVDPADPRHVLAGGTGLWNSRDGGDTWAADDAGLIREGIIWTLASFDGVIYAGGTTGVYRRTEAGWERVSSQQGVYSLDAGSHGDIWASSMGYGLEVLRDGRWVREDAGLAGHGEASALSMRGRSMTAMLASGTPVGHGGREVHVDGFTWLGPTRAVEATMDDGVAVSTDGGASWSSLSPGFQPGGVWQVLPVKGGLLAATSTGLFLYVTPPGAPPGPVWWLLVGLAAATVPVCAALAGLAARRARRAP